VDPRYGVPLTGDGVHWSPVRRSGRIRARQARVPDHPSDQGPVRTCVGCRVRAPADDLLRVVAVDGALAPDPRRRLPGRGAWLHPVPECLARAERRSAFPRALRVPGPLDVDRVRSYLQAGAAPRGPAQHDSSTTPA
jgi:uncharacterized protein